jgi:hypothetical protein
MYSQRSSSNVYALCRFIASHEAGVVAVTETTVTVCGFWTRGKQFGWRVETLPADWQSVRDWLGY